LIPGSAPPLPGRRDMLKALELAGFKSFADKTRLEFPPGISVVVGPNGSGKSNVVDAIKWVLGEQSVKSLRGKEMADVIFNGSASRHPLNSAETTLTFDNGNSTLPIDTAEVHVTRRVYRNGEGEYLINRQPCRLRDIRDLLSGTGVGSDGYSVIEQGKVDAMLQASPRDRRVIFEEAAGISRFRAKKVETQRRLERVEQNLLRLADIVEEVESRLRSVRLQASKARRYKEAADRLQELRTQVGLADWRRLTDRLTRYELDIQTLTDEVRGLSAQAEAVEARTLALDAELGDMTETIRACEARLSQNRERIAGCESAIEHQRHRSQDLEEELARARRQAADLTTRAGDLDQRLQETAAAVSEAEARHASIATRLSLGEDSLTRLTAELRGLRQQNEDRRAAYLTQLRASTALAQESSTLEARRAAANAARERADERLAELATARDELARQGEVLRTDVQAAQAEADRRKAELADVEEDLVRQRERQAEHVRVLGESRQRHSAIRERISVLDELEKRFEGHGVGVKEVMRQARSEDPGPFRGVLGLVAELFHVSIENAPLVEFALGEAIGYVVVGPDAELLRHLGGESHGLVGRVGFLRLEAEELTEPAPKDLSALPGVLTRADQLIETSPQFARLRDRLLAGTWVVESLQRAMELSRGPGRGQSFVTPSGECLTAAGTLIAGTRQATTGIISRRSELRALRGQAQRMEEEIEAAQRESSALAAAIAAQEGRVAQIGIAHRRALDAAAECRLKCAAADDRHRQTQQQQAAVEGERAASLAEFAAAGDRLEAVAKLAQEHESRMTALETAGADVARRIEEVDQQRQQQVRAATAAQVELAKSEERLDHLRAQWRQLEQDQSDRRRAMDDHRGRFLQVQGRLRESAWQILNAETTVAELYLVKEAIAREVVDHINRREDLRRSRAELSDQSQRLRDQARQAQERLHKAELSAGEVRLERGGLASRLRDDYGIELAELEHQPTDDEQQQRELADREIAELRRKLNGMGSVNLDALPELEELEVRFARLTGQYNDLTSAKASLLQIIGKINADSRRLFADTLETVRGHFQGLFRKLFGGGQADLVLEEGVDILESGIDIVAKPPGKDLPNISLYSGGERTLTSVALLLALFRSRPSPFCVLDEVDANLDEANIDRFIGVLKEFLSSTQFIIVTHSKRTMTCASTLYGVTMQESGISKPVSVRFDDVSENGEIRPQSGRDDAIAAGADDETQAA
jgi:chromosome segregation protein